MRTSFLLPACAALAALAGCSRPVEPRAAAIPPAPSSPSAPIAAAPVAPAPPAPRQWQVEELAADVEALAKGRNFAQGRKVFMDLNCGGCHAFSTYAQGGGHAPDLTPVGSKMTREALLLSIIDPSFEINGQYQGRRFKLKNGGVIEGTVLEAGDGRYVVAPVMLSLETTIEIREADLLSEEISDRSQMPSGLLTGLTRDQVLDLIAFLVSGGQSDAAVFQK